MLQALLSFIEDIYLHSLPIKEYQIIDQFFQPGVLKDEVMKIHQIQPNKTQIKNYSETNKHKTTTII